MFHIWPPGFGRHSQLKRGACEEPVEIAPREKSAEHVESAGSERDCSTEAFELNKAVQPRADESVAPACPGSPAGESENCPPPEAMRTGQRAASEPPVRQPAGQAVQSERERTLQPVLSPASSRSAASSRSRGLSDCDSSARWDLLALSPEPAAEPAARLPALGSATVRGQRTPEIVKQFRGQLKLSAGQIAEQPVGRADADERQALPPATPPGGAPALVPVYVGSNSELDRIVI